jgi:hypothetical protein
MIYYLVPDNYPSSGGIGERGAWFRDSEGNLLAVGPAVAPAREIKLDQKLNGFISVLRKNTKWIEVMEVLIPAD